MKFLSNKFRNYAMVALATIALASCSNDDFMDDTPSLKAEGMATAPQGILPGVQPANGAWVTSSISRWFKGFYKSHGNNLPSSFALAQGNFETDYSPGGRAFNGYYYTLNNTSTGERGIRRLSASGSSFSNDITLRTSNEAIEGQKDEVNFTLFDATHGYYTDGQGLPEGFIGEFNPTTMQNGTGFNVKAGVISELGGTYTGADVRKIGTKLLIRRGNYLYADVTFGTGRNKLNQIKQSTNNIYVAVINVNTHNVETVLVGYGARNIGLFNDHPLVCIDPSTNAIYFATVADMDIKYEGQAGQFSKIFKIADSGNSIPSMTPIKSYADVTPNNFEGEFNTLYVYGGKIYTKIANTSVRYGTFDIHGQNYRQDIWQYAIISANGSTAFIKKNDGSTLMDNFYAYQQPQLINGQIYMISNTNAGSKVYKINPGNANATLVTTGTAGGWGWGLVYQDKISSIVKL